VWKLKLRKKSSRSANC